MEKEKQKRLARVGQSSSDQGPRPAKCTREKVKILKSRKWHKREALSISETRRLK